MRRRVHRARLNLAHRAKLTASAGVLVIAALVAGFAPTLSTAAGASGQAVTIWGSAPTARALTEHDSGSVELGTVFHPTVDGTITGIRFWKLPGNSGSHSAHLWTSDGRMLASATFVGESRSGWQIATLSRPVAVSAGRSYVASYHAPRGHYSQTVDFSGASTSPQLAVPSENSGVYAYGSTPRFPSAPWRSAQYWVDVLFVPGGGSTPGATPTATPTSTPTKSPTPSPTPTQTPKPSTTPTPSPTPTSTSTAAPGGGSSAPSTPGVALGWTLTASNVGLAPFGLKCSQLPVYTQAGNRIPAGTTIVGKRLTTWYDLDAGNITISKSCIQPTPGSVGKGSPTLSTISNELQGPVTIEDSEFDGSLLTSAAEAAYIGPFQGVANMYRNYIHHWGSGISMMGTDEKTGSNVVVENNYVTDMVSYGDASGSGNHSSAFNLRDWDVSVNPNRQLLVDNNRFDDTTPNSTGAFFIQPYAGPVSNATITGNLLEGDGYNLILQDYGSNTSKNMKATNNRMRPLEYGPTSTTSKQGWTVFFDNYLYDSSAANAAGAAVDDAR